ncbi:putative P-loop containing nucleoside triphosphate hydrolase, leucine-rich repeat domain, L [Medicago truncatula]|uniref:Putative P-loop containing nucleoside triphosphate hydrolase, leucine-rich repeat domain, L n=1 Tax=Medicago truncatula TaxID=3880 RepID=A0A396IP88_MEDTR|nr:putative P-loop containing nucleoside triphosphate hydrolase, leucine-rich repeat domain, L [Medicago truncatula]
MAATLVGGAFLSASVQTMLDQLTSTEFRDFINNRKLNVSLLKQLQATLLVLQAVLDDAEEKQINNRAVKQWLDDLKDALFDAEDLLNQISYDSLRCKVEDTQAANKTNQVWNFLSSPFNTFYREINSQMKIMCDSLQIFAQHKDILGLQTKIGKVSRRTPSSSVVNESVMVGRNDDKETVMNMLLSESSTRNNNIGVVAILGMGGVGKTTLAQLVYNDEKVQEHFDLKAWACVSEDFDISTVTKTLLESVTSRAWENNNLDFLRVELKKTLRDKRFLFVLDDLWNDNYNEWDELVTPLINGNSGSRVIVTTRQQKVAEVAHTFPIHKLEVLSNEDTWSLLSKHAFGSENFCDNKCSNLEAIGRKIARKCAGLPIAAKTLGGVLRSKRDAKEWTEVLNNKIWNLPNDNVLPALLLSYQYLPSQLKRCFSYCSIFPKDYSLNRKQLVLLWMAEGFLDHSKDEKPMEDVGDDCFAELLSRSLIQQLHVGTREQKFVMHDLVNDLATIVSGKTCSRVEFGGDTSKNVRHCSYSQEEYDIVKKFKIFYKFKCLRTFLPCCSWRTFNYLSKRVVDDLLPTFGRLRVLSLSKYRNITMLPDSICSLVQLRYLDLSHTKIKSLPDIICNLYYLQTLILSFCSNLIELPEHVGKLINLRHLDIDFTGITEMPKQIVELENLQTLTVFIVGKKNVGLSVRELARFPKLQGKLFIKNLQNVIDVVEAYDADLKSKEHIEELTLQWGIETDDSLKGKDVLDMLKPPVNLNRLNIALYGGTSFPCWLGDSSFSNMVSLCIENCGYCVTLPPLGQLSSLKDLKITGMSILETIGPEFYGMVEGGSNSSFHPFPSLEKLEFTNMPNWKKWLPFQDGILPFPCLKTLMLCDCPELRGNLPNHLSSIEAFVIECCPHLLESPPTLEWLSSIKEIDISGDLHSSETQWPFVESDSPCLLQWLVIDGCTGLESIFISESSSDHPSTLQSLSVYSCKALISLPQRMDTLTTLERLHFYHLPKLEFALYEGVFLPPKLQTIYITSVRITKMPPLIEWGFQSLTYLSNLYIKDNDDVVHTLLKEQLLPISLVFLSISNLSEAKCLDGNGLRYLSSLETLSFHDCQRLESFPEHSLPSSLKLLRIYRCPILEERYESEGGRNWSEISYIPVIEINGKMTI